MVVRMGRVLVSAYVDFHGRNVCPVTIWQHLSKLVLWYHLWIMNRRYIMPYWFAKEQWHAQFLENKMCALGITLAMINANSQPVENICYCPVWKAGQKKGRPKKEQWQLRITRSHSELSRQEKEMRWKVGWVCQLWCRVTIYSRESGRGNYGWPKAGTHTRLEGRQYCRQQQQCIVIRDGTCLI